MSDLEAGPDGLSDTAAAENAALALAVLTRMADDEVAIAERYSARARQAFAFAAAMFAVAQAGITAALASDHVSTGERRVTLVVSVVAGVLVVVCGAVMLAAERLRPTEELTPEALIEALNAAEETGDRLVFRLVEIQARVAISRKQSTVERLKWVGRSRAAAVVAVAAILVELVDILIARH